MRVRIIGSAAGGGFPQWNCNCPVCTAAREGRAEPRTQSSIVVRSGEEPWYLVNASPDLLRQLEDLPADRSRAALEPDRGRRPHRRGDRPHRGPAAAARVPAAAARLLDRRGARRADRELPADDDAGALLRRRVARAGDRWDADRARRFLAERRDLPDRRRRAAIYGGRAGPGAVGLTVRDSAGDGTLVYVPAIEELGEATSARLAEGDVVLADGTFFRHDDLVSLGMGRATPGRWATRR